MLSTQNQINIQRMATVFSFIMCCAIKSSQGRPDEATKDFLSILMRIQRNAVASGRRRESRPVVKRHDIKQCIPDGTFNSTSKYAKPDGQGRTRLALTQWAADTHGKPELNDCAISNEQLIDGSSERSLDNTWIDANGMAFSNVGMVDAVEGGPPNSSGVILQGDFSGTSFVDCVLDATFYRASLRGAEIRDSSFDTIPFQIILSDADGAKVSAMTFDKELNIMYVSGELELETNTRLLTIIKSSLPEFNLHLNGRELEGFRPVIQDSNVTFGDHSSITPGATVYGDLHGSIISPEVSVERPDDACRVEKQISKQTDGNTLGVTNEPGEEYNEEKETCGITSNGLGSVFGRPPLNITEEDTDHFDTDSAGTDGNDTDFVDTDSAGTDDHDTDYFDTDSAGMDDHDTDYFDTDSAGMDDHDTSLFDTDSAGIDDHDTSLFDTDSAGTDDHDTDHFDTDSAGTDDHDTNFVDTESVGTDIIIIDPPESSSDHNWLLISLIAAGVALVAWYIWFRCFSSQAQIFTGTGPAVHREWSDDEEKGEGKEDGEVGLGIGGEGEKDEAPVSSSVEYDNSANVPALKGLINLFKWAPHRLNSELNAPPELSDEESAHTEARLYKAIEALLEAYKVKFDSYTDTNTVSKFALEQKVCQKIIRFCADPVQLHINVFKRDKSVDGECSKRVVGMVDNFCKQATAKVEEYTPEQLLNKEAAHIARFSVHAGGAMKTGFQSVTCLGKEVWEEEMVEVDLDPQNESTNPEDEEKQEQQCIIM